MFEIRFTDSALEDIAWFRVRDRRIIFGHVQHQLTHEPTAETRNRKRLRPNRTAEWELRMEPFRVFYDVDADDGIVEIRAVGRKSGNNVIVRGKDFQL